MALFNRRRQFRPPVRRWLPASVASPTIALTDVVDRTGIQRASGVGSLTISGTHTGATSVQARVVLHGTSTEVVTWTTIDASPGATTWTGTLTNIPTGGWYNVQVRPGNATGITADGSNRFGVGALVAIAGQSQTTRYFTTGTDVTPDALLAEYSGSDGTGWAARTTTGNGANAFGNRLITELGGTVPVFLLNYSVGATALNSAGGGSGYWMNTAGGSPYDLFIDGVISAGGKLEAVFWAQGEQDGFSTAVSEAQYQSDLETFIARIRTDLGQASLPFIITPLGRYTNAGPTNASWQGIKNAQLTVGEQANNGLAASNDDLALVDGVHYTNAAAITHATRGAIATAFALGESAYERGPRYVSALKTSSTTVVVTIAHDGGSDFTPTSGITGWEVLDGGTPATISSAVRTTATTITLTVSAPLAGVVTVRHLYGFNPTVSGILIDDSADTLPADGVPEAAVSSGLGIPVFVHHYKQMGIM